MNLAQTFIGVCQPVAFQGDFRLELFTAQITEMSSLRVVSIHMSLQVAPTAACVVTQAADIRLQTYKRTHSFSDERFLQYTLLLLQCNYILNHILTNCRQ